MFRHLCVGGLETTHMQPDLNLLTDRLPMIYGSSARLTKLCFDARFTRLLETAGLALAISPLAEAPKGSLYRVQVGTDTGLLEFAVNAPDHPALSIIAAPEADEGLRRLASHALFEPWLSQLDSWGIKGAQALSVDLLPIGAGHSHAGWCVARDAMGRETRFTALRWPDAAHEAMCQQLRRVAVRRRRYRQLALSGTVLLGVRGVALNTLRSLSPGDVLIAPWLGSPNGLSVSVRWGHCTGRTFTATGILQNTSLTIKGTTAMSELDESTEERTSDDPVDTLGELDIPVHFEIDTVAVPLADLEAIQPGYVIELAAPVDLAPIRLTAYGQTIGLAQLVAVGDRLGARITRMVTRDEHQPST